MIAVGLYTLMLLTLIPYMKTRAPPDRNVLNPIVALWNLLLSTFSSTKKILVFIPLSNGSFEVCFEFF